MAFLIDDILLAPCNFVTWIGRTLYDQAETQLTDESAVQARLLDLQTQWELEQISEKDFLDQEAALMQRLNAIHKYKQARHQA
jgi:hypothetical protein